MKKSLLLTILCLPFMAQANDSTGTVSTGGVEYIKNEHIAMQKENLFISQDKIKVEYEYRNMTDKDITETVLFPLPEVMLHDLWGSDNICIERNKKIWREKMR